MRCGKCLVDVFESGEDFGVLAVDHDCVLKMGGGLAVARAALPAVFRNHDVRRP